MTSHRKLAGRYQLLGVIGSGGMGTVWRARDETLGREVAIKELMAAPELDEAGRADASARAVREAQAAAQLRHPGIIVVHDAFIEDERPWIVMQLLQGQSLDAIIKQQGPISPAFAAEIGLQLVQALTAAHTAGILHRDVKPGNIFLTADGRAILTDFGIATVEGQATITRSGMLVGSPGHIAPERLRGERAGPQSDLWSLAATIYRAVEGVSPHHGSDHMVVLTKVLTQEPRPPVAAGELAPLLLHMLAKDPRARPEPPVVEEVLGRVAQGGASGAIPLPPPPPVVQAEARTTVDVNWKPPRKNGGFLIPLLAGAVVGVLMATAAVVVAMDKDTAADPVVAATASGGPVTAPITPSAPAAKFTVPIDLCTVATIEQVRQIVPDYKDPEGKAGGSDKEPECSWDAPGAGFSVGLRNIEFDADPWSFTPEDAHDYYRNSLQASDGSDKVIWHYSGIGGESITSGPETKAESLTGIGDEAFVTDTKGRIGAQMSKVTFRISNIIVKVTHADVTNKTGSEKIHDNAIQLARWVAENLGKR